MFVDISFVRFSLPSGIFHWQNWNVGYDLTLKRSKMAERKHVQRNARHESLAQQFKFQLSPLDRVNRRLKHVRFLNRNSGVTAWRMNALRSEIQSQASASSTPRRNRQPLHFVLRAGNFFSLISRSSSKRFICSSFFFWLWNSQSVGRHAAFESLKWKSCELIRVHSLAENRFRICFCCLLAPYQLHTTQHTSFYWFSCMSLVYICRGIKQNFRLFHVARRVILSWNNPKPESRFVTKIEFVRSW